MADQVEEEVRRLFLAMTTAWNAGDAAAYARCFTPTADYLAFDGQWYRGRAEIERCHREVFEFMRGSKLVYGSTFEVRRPAHGVAVVIAEGAALLPWQTEPRRGRLSVNTSVAVKMPDGDWLLSTFQNTRVSPKPIPKGIVGALVKGLIGLMPRRI